MAEQRTDLPHVRIPGGVHLGTDVRLQGIRPELLVGLLIVSDMCIRQGLSAIFTHVLDGSHMKNSLHYTGAAVDFTIDLIEGRSAWVVELRERIGPAYDVIDEGTHIHIEYQPHTGAVT